MSAQATLNVGLVGLGSMGWRHLETLCGIEGVTVAGVADVDPRTLEAAHARFGTAGHVRWEDLLGAGGLDAVFISTPPRWHAGPAVAALEQGVAAFVEKPLARDLDAARAIVDAQRASGAVGALGYQWRAVDFLDEVRAGLTGHRLGLLAGRSIGPSRPRSWFMDWEQGGGVLLELASHDIDLQRALAGEVASVQAAAGDPVIADGGAPGIPSVLSITLRFECGALGAIQVAWLDRALPPSWALDVVSDRAAHYLVLDPHFTLRGHADGVAIERRAQTSPVRHNITRFLGAVRAGDPSDVYCDLADGARTLAVALACEEALASGTTVIPASVRPT